MFAVVRTGGKQYRVAPGDKIVVEKIAGDAGDSIDLTDILLAGEGSDLKSVAGLIVTAEVIAQAKADKVTVFKKRRRHNYRRKAGHRQQHTILRITAIGDEKAKPKTAKPAAAAAAPDKPAPSPKPAAKPSDAPKVDVQEVPNTAPDDPAKANPDKPATEQKAAPAKAKPAAKAAPAKAKKEPAKAAPAKAEKAPAKAAAKAPSTKNAAPAKAAAKKSPKAK